MNDEKELSEPVVIDHVVEKSREGEPSRRTQPTEAEELEKLGIKLDERDQLLENEVDIEWDDDEYGTPHDCIICGESHGYSHLNDRDN